MESKSALFLPPSWPPRRKNRTLTFSCVHVWNYKLKNPWMCFCENLFPAGFLQTSSFHCCLSIAKTLLLFMMHFLATCHCMLFISKPDVLGGGNTLAFFALCNQVMPSLIQFFWLLEMFLCCASSAKEFCKCFFCIPCLLSAELGFTLSLLN